MAERARKKPVEVEFMVFTGKPKNATLLVQWVLDNGATARWHEATPPRLHSVHCGCDGRGIVPGRMGHAVPCPETEPEGPGDPEHVAIDTLEGTMRADVGDVVIRGVQGEFYPCKPEIFAATYDVLGPAPSAGSTGEGLTDA